MASEFGSHFITVTVDATKYWSNARKLIRELAGTEGHYNRTKWLHLDFSYIKEGLKRMESDFKNIGGFLYRELDRYGQDEQNRASNAYEQSQEDAPSYGGMYSFINDSKFYTIEQATEGMRLSIGNIKDLDDRTMGWKTKYANVPSDAWFPNPPPYLNANHGYWVWQEMGAGPPQHWTKYTMRMHPDDYQQIGGNIEARHIFLQGAGILHEQQKVNFRGLMHSLVVYNPWRFG